MRKRLSLVLNLSMWITALTTISIGNIFAGSLTFSAQRTSPQDLEVISVANDGTDGPSRFVTWEQLAAQPLAHVTSPKDSNTKEPATYDGIYFKDLFALFGATPSQDLIEAASYDKYVSYLDQDFIRNHEPLLVLKFNGHKPADWPLSEHHTSMAPYDIGYGTFVPVKKAGSYSEPAIDPFGVTIIKLTSYKQTVAVFRPKIKTDDPEVKAGHFIAITSCLNCHNLGNAGGQLAGRPWQLLSIESQTNPTYFRKHVLNASAFVPTTAMPSFPFDEPTLNALQAYFNAMAPMAAADKP